MATAYPLPSSEPVAWWVFDGLEVAAPEIGYPWQFRVFRWGNEIDAWMDLGECKERFEILIWDEKEDYGYVS